MPRHGPNLLKHETTLTEIVSVQYYLLFFPKFEHISVQVATLNVDVAREYNSVATHCLWHQVKLI